MKIQILFIFTFLIHSLCLSQIDVNTSGDLNSTKNSISLVDNYELKITNYEYNSQDQITFLTYQAGATDEKEYMYNYDYAGRLADMGYLSDPDINNPNGFYKNFTSYSYNPNSQVIEQSYGDYFTSNAYLYDNRNRVIDFYNGNSMFMYTLNYYKNSNVKTQGLYGAYRDYFQNTTDLELTYTYDRSNRLLNTYNTC